MKDRAESFRRRALAIRKTVLGPIARDEAAAPALEAAGEMGSQVKQEMWLPEHGCSLSILESNLPLYSLCARPSSNV